MHHNSFCGSQDTNRFVAQSKYNEAREWLVWMCWCTMNHASSEDKKRGSLNWTVGCKGSFSDREEKAYWKWLIDLHAITRLRNGHENLVKIRGKKFCQEKYENKPDHQFGENKYVNMSRARNDCQKDSKWFLSFCLNSAYSVFPSHTLHSLTFVAPQCL